MHPRGNTYETDTQSDPVTRVTILSACTSPSPERAGVLSSVAALYVETGGCYFGVPGVDPWDEPRDARKYSGPHPVVAHPPCQRWGKLWAGQPLWIKRTGERKIKGDDDGCFAAALAAVIRYGGVIEHPWQSHAWPHFDITVPPRSGGWVDAGAPNLGWTCCVEQGRYGHYARKPTMLYVSRDYLLGVEPKDIDIFMGEYAGTCEPEPKETPAFCFTDFSIPDPRCGLFRIDNEHERFEEYAAVSDIMMVSSGTLLGVKVDAVLIDKFEGGEKLIKDFDFGITRCWYDGAIHDTPEAQSDRKRCVVTLLSDEREVRSIARFERLNARWGGGWKLERDASAIEARRAETGTGSVEDESAIPEGDAHV